MKRRHICMTRPCFVCDAWWLDLIKRAMRIAYGGDHNDPLFWRDVYRSRLVDRSLPSVMLPKTARRKFYELTRAGPAVFYERTEPGPPWYARCEWDGVA